ncbi:MAG: hypothetical protein HYZ14_09760 [Bacteroidetes bacterium]|nr:hypothetical protein [Bacteroidota bacterium]
MKKNYFALFLSLLVGFASTVSAGENGKQLTLQIPDQNYMVLYVETADTDLVSAFITEMESYTNKVIDANYNYNTHEFTIVFTDHLRNDTIYQILLRYFQEFEEVDGYYPNHK